MKRILIFLSIIIVAIIIVQSCNNKKGEKQLINKVNYEDFLKDAIDSTFVVDVNPITDISKKNLNDKLLDYFGDLNEDQLNQLFNLELESLQKADNITLGATNMAIAQDSTNTIFRRCGTSDSADSTAFKNFSNKRFRSNQFVNRSYTVPITFYVINKFQNDWAITRTDLNQQVQVLNQAYQTLNIEFKIKTINHYTNDNWFLAFSSNLKEDAVYNGYYDDMVSEIDPDPNILNVFINGCNLLGQASFPFEETTYKTKYDNVLINKYCMVGKSFPKDSEVWEGETLIHEMGHFFGLYHTFHSDQDLGCNHKDYNGCEGEGDFVDDTPPQRYCHEKGCGKCKNNLGCDSCYKASECKSCTSNQQPDDVKNFMGYNPDTCMEHFTQGQYNRMELYFSKFRLYLVDNISYVNL